MDYTKFVRSQNSNQSFKFTLTNEYVKTAMETLTDISKAKNIISNYFNIDYQVDIDEYFAYFLKEKNEFITDFSLYISKSKNLPKAQHILYSSILTILKRNLDDVLTNFKLLKQRLYRKLKRQERYNQSKIDFIKSIPENNIKLCNVLNQGKNQHNQKPKKNFIQTFEISAEEETAKYKESPNIIHIFMNSASKNYEKTKQILYELSDLMTTVQTKIFEQSEMTKAILFNSEVSLTNVEQGNKELVKAQEYQKGRGIMYGLIFILLGLFLLLYDYTI